MRIQHTDKEQIEMLKTFWNEYGKSLLIAVIVGLGLGYGWHYWQSYRVNELSNASMIYQNLLQVTMQNPNDTQEIAAIANDLMTNYKTTPYAAMGAFFWGKSLIEQNQLSEALEKFNWVIAHNHNNMIQQIARLRAARILIAQNNFSQAKQYYQKAAKEMAADNIPDQILAMKLAQ